MTELAGAHVPVTGGSRGIGRALAEALADAGSRISLVARSSASVADAARGFGGVGVGVDLSDEEQLFGLVGRIESAAGPIDVLVNNAGVEIHQHLADQSAADVRAAVTTNLLSPVELTRQALPGMLARDSGHIVNVSSLAGSAGYPGMTTYAASKAGLTAFSRTLALDLSGLPVGVTSVEVGTVPTDMLAAIGAEDSYGPTRAAFARAYRLRLMVDVPTEQVAAAIVRAVRDDRRKVWLPRRTAAMAALSEAPQRIVELMLQGVPKHERL